LISVALIGFGDAATVSSMSSTRCMVEPRSRFIAYYTGYWRSGIKRLNLISILTDLVKKRENGFIYSVLVVYGVFLTRFIIQHVDSFEFKLSEQF
jgi:hypothetical protein